MATDKVKRHPLEAVKVEKQSHPLFERGLAVKPFAYVEKMSFAECSGYDPANIESILKTMLARALHGEGNYSNCGTERDAGGHIVPNNFPPFDPSNKICLGLWFEPKESE